jgi:uncharacterized protein
MGAAESFILFKTSSGNSYAYETKINQIFLLHPVLYFMLEKYKESSNKDWFEDLIKEGIIIDNHHIPREEIEKYHKKLLFFTKLGLFQKKSYRRNLDGQIQSRDIQEMLANVKQLTFEVTDCCQLYCGYCGYGKFYDDYDKRENKNINVKIGKNVLNFFLNFWNSPLNNSHDKNIYIGFYGGEPLLNMRFIKEIVKYVGKLPALHNRFTFAITTNGILLGKNMDFLVQNDFNILISLDGSRNNNEYRVFRNGNPAFDIILRNIDIFRKKFPGYFRSKVNFNAVVHNKNSITEIYRYFKDNFDKVPSISELNTSGIKESQKKNFWKTYLNVNESLKQSQNHEIIEKDMFINLPGIRSVGNFLTMYSGHIYRNYNDLLFLKTDLNKIPTGTCLPFSKKVFVTVNGKILPCERISHRYALGYANDKNVILEIEKIAEKYNNYYDKLRKQCRNCYRNETCTQCMFYLNIDDEKPLCKGFMNREEFSKYLSNYIGYLERKPEIYFRLMREAVID